MYGIMNVTQYVKWTFETSINMLTEYAQTDCALFIRIAGIKIHCDLTFGQSKTWPPHIRLENRVLV